MSQDQFMKWLRAYAADLEAPKSSVSSEYDEGYRSAEYNIGEAIMRQLARLDAS